MNLFGKISLSLIVVAAAVFLVSVFYPTVAHADTDGSEIQITDQPDQLILQLGPYWAGVEFELRTDAGVFPVPVVADAVGVLRMDLGGSKSYTLSCVMSSVTVPVPQNDMESPAPESTGAVQENTPAPERQEKAGSIPTSHLIMFLGGLAIAVASC